MTQLLPGFDDPIPGPHGLDRGRATSSASVQAHRRALATILDRDRWPDRTGGGGDGVLYCGGGKFWPGIVIGCRLLRESGYSGAIEVWHRGEAEPVHPADVADLNVHIIDSRALADRLGDARVLNGWESKHYALTHTTLDRVAYLDADAYGVTDLQPLIEKSAGKFAFWIDLPGNDRTVKWPNVWPAGSGGVPSIQGGQLFLDLAACWRQVVLSHWMNQHSDFYYHHGYGDQDTWRMAFAALPGPLLCFGHATWRYPAFVCQVDGRDWIVHRCRGKLFRPEDSPAGSRNVSHAPARHLPKEDRVWELLVRQFGDRASADIFPAMYRRNVWGRGSGMGSVGPDAQDYGWLINTLATVGGWRSATDAGCGDGEILARLAFERYHGVDVYDGVIEANRRRFPNRTFAVADFYRDRDVLPPADVLLCRDVLHHWPNAMVTEFVTWARSCGRWPWLCFTQDVHQQADGDDTFLGGYRPLHPDMEPLKSLAPTRFVKIRDKTAVLWRCP